jgi:hypothetical protein
MSRKRCTDPVCCFTAVPLVAITRAGEGQSFFAAGDVAVAVVAAD